MTVKSFLYIVFISCCISCALPSFSAARPDKIRVVMDNNYPPYVFLDSAGRLQGILIDQWRLWEQKNGIKVEITAMDWGKAVNAMKAGEYDVIDTLFKNDERSGWLDFTKPYATIEVPIFFDSDISGITDAASLKGFAVADKRGDAMIDVLKQNGVDNIQLFDSFETLIQAAKEKKVHVFVMGKPPAKYFLHKYGIDNRFKQTEPLQVNQFCRAVKKGNSELLAIVNDGFAAIPHDKLKQIDTKWYGSSLENKIPLTLIFIGLGGIVFIALILIAWNRSLKSNVAMRTAELKSTEEALRRSEEKFRKHVECSTDVIFTLNAEGVFVFVSPAWERHFGYSVNEILGRSFTLFVHPDDLLPLGEYLKHVLDSGQAETSPPYRVKCIDGTWRLFEANGSTFVDSGEELHFIGVGHDITERKIAEEALEESWERYRGLSEAGFETIFFSEKGICTEQNKNAALMFGYSDSEAIGRAGTEWIIPEDRDLVMKNMASGYEEPYEVTALRKNGTTFPALIRAKMMHYRGKNVRVTSLSDISDRKKAEEDRLNLERQLLHSQKLESLGVLSGGIAHDFNNLLHALLGNLDIALMRLPQDVPVRKNIDQAIKAAVHAAQLTNMMLAYSGKGLFVIKPLNLTELMEENATMLEAAIPKSITLEQCLDSALPIIKADAGQLQQVIMNLITNASEAIGDQGGKIRLSTGVKDFDQDTLNSSRLAEKQAAGRYVWMEVCDSGCGMNEEILQKLFDPFFTTKFTGRGLGMSAVLGIIRAHKGAFLVESRMGVGTNIQVLFPVVDDHPNEADQVIESEFTESGSVGYSVKVLVVDDEDMIRDVSTAMLEELGYETLAAASGEEAVELFRRESVNIDLVLLDQVMPGMDGVTVFKELRLIRQDIKVLLASGFSQQEVSERFSGLGLNGFLPKPYTLKDLTEELSRVLKSDLK